MPLEPPPSASGDSRRGALLSAEEFKTILGRTPEPKLQMVLVGDDLYSRSGESWWRHPPYPVLDAVCP